LGPLTPPRRSSLPSRFSDDVAEIAREVYGDEAALVLESLTKPVSTYYVRCNVHKIAAEDLQSKLEKRGLIVKHHPVIQEALGIEVEGPFDIPLYDQEVAVDKQTAESVLQGADVYAPGILDIGSLHVGDKVTIVTEFGDAIASGHAVMNANDALTFRKGLAIRVDHQRYRGPRIRDLPEFSQGLLYPQSLAAMTTVHVLNPKANETIVDMNCAPGGKLSHISQMTSNSGRVFGFDRNSQKIAKTRRNLTTLGCRNAILSIEDTRYLPNDLPTLKADRVLIDPPCSALGLRPKVHDLTKRERVDNLASYQKQFIKAASKVAKPGGVVVYSVCTFTVQECEQVADFAEHECGLRAVEQRPMIGSTGLAVYGALGSLCQRFHPYTDEIGYFIAKFEREK
jgi:predicted RNA-binding protein (TIGR00451 family)